MTALESAAGVLAGDGGDGRRISPKQVVTDWLLARIRSGQFRPGSQLPTEPRLCELLGVSRSSVREAIQRLAVAGVLEVRHGIGTHVRETTAESVLKTADLLPLLAPHGMLDLIELREIFEAGVVALASARATTEELAAVENVLSCGARVGQGSVAAVDADERFHLALAEATHNGAVVQMMGLLNGLFRRCREKNLRATGALERAQRAHVLVFEAIRARDSERAQDAVLTNFELLRQQVIAEARAIVQAAEERGGMPVRPRRSPRRSSPGTDTVPSTAAVQLAGERVHPGADASGVAGAREASGG